MPCLSVSAGPRRTQTTTGGVAIPPGDNWSTGTASPTRTSANSRSPTCRKAVPHRQGKRRAGPADSSPGRRLSPHLRPDHYNLPRCLTPRTPGPERLVVVRIAGGLAHRAAEGGATPAVSGAAQQPSAVQVGATSAGAGTRLRRLTAWLRSAGQIHSRYCGSMLK